MKNRIRSSIADSLTSISRIWARNFFLFKRAWLVSAFWIVLEPLFILGALGYGLGSYVTTINGRPYVDFFFPALLCNSSMFVAFFVSTYDNFSKLTYQRTYLTQILTPIEPNEIVLGEILWGATKGTMSAIGVSIIAMFFGLVDPVTILPAFLVIFISSAVFAALGMIVTTMVHNYEQIIYPSSGIIIPMSLFCGTFFPVESLPIGIKQAIYLLPLTHSVSAVRSLLLNGFEWTVLLHSLILIILLVVLTRIAIRRLAGKLLN
ncbi:MAG: transport permease protein [Oligoflexia bacterium]|nr:MAG: transport permease protein [Oligoflexia bacterium]